MWTHEKSLTRDNKNINWNLCIGDPVIIRNQLKSMAFEAPSLSKLDYPSLEVLPELESAIRAFVGKHTGEFIVPTIGAKHALHAAVYALTRSGLKKKVTAPVPFWVSYPTIARYADCDWTEHIPLNYWDSELIEIIASPNNPDGWIWTDAEVVPYRKTLRIWDAAYASPLYGFNAETVPLHDISVWSGGKLTGLPGLRVGWMTTSNETYANDARQFVEQTTSGVSQLTQLHAAQALRYLGHNISIVEKVREQIQENQDLILGTLGELAEPMDSKINPGMFLWMKSRNPEVLDKALASAKISVLRGEACGKTDSGWYRWALGQPVEFTRAAMEDLRKHL